MAFEHREGSGALFRNGKRTAETQPNARGDALIGGVLYEISAWTKTTKNGDKWQSLTFKPKDAPRDAPPPPPKGNDGGLAEMDDNIPF